MTDPLAARVLRHQRLRCPTCTEGLVADYDTRGVYHHRACTVCGGTGTVGSGYTPHTAKDN